MEGAGSSHCIFINYRREDSAPAAARLAEALKEEFPGGVFIDEDIPTGSRWTVELERELNRSTVALVLIGEKWLHVQNEESGRRRLDEDDDVVRREIEHALKGQRHIVPVLVDGAAMPGGEHLPDPIRKLVERQGTRLRTKRNDDWTSDRDRIIRDIRELPADMAPSAASVAPPAIASPLAPAPSLTDINMEALAPRSRSHGWRKAVLASALIGVAAAMVVVFLWQRSDASPIISAGPRPARPVDERSPERPRPLNDPVGPSTPAQPDPLAISPAPTSPTPAKPPTPRPQPKFEAEAAPFDVTVQCEKVSRCLVANEKLRVSRVQPGKPALPATLAIDDQCRVRIEGFPARAGADFSLALRVNQCSIAWQGSLAKLRAKPQLTIQHCLCGKDQSEHRSFDCDTPCKK